MRTSDTAKTKTVNMARASATLPRVEGSINLGLRYTQQFLNRKALRTSHRSLLRKFLELLDPRAWTLAYVVSALATAAAGLFLNTSYRLQASFFKSPLFPVGPISEKLQLGLAVCVGATILVFHFLLNYRRRGRGGLIKSYWYAGWTFALTFFFLPLVHQPLSHHRANQINEYCFVAKKTEKCSRYLKQVYAGQRPREVLSLFPEKKRAWVDAQFKKIDPPLVALTEEKPLKGPAARLKSSRRLASPIALPH